MTSQAFLRLRGLFARLKAGPAGAAGRAGTAVEGSRSQPGGAPPAGVVAPGSTGNDAGVEDPTRSLEAALTEGLDEVRQYLGVLRRQNIAMSIKVARTERRLEDLSSRLEALGHQHEAVGEDGQGNPPVGI